MTELTRRRFLRESSLVGAAATFGLAGCLRRPVTAAPPASSMTIGQAGGASGVLAGAAVSVRALRSSAPYAELIRTQCRIVVAENEMKFASLRPAPDTFFFDDADTLVHFAEQNNIRVRGHNFMWHRQLPPWFAGYATQANAENLLIGHIERVGGRYAGRMHSWDVANEVIHVPDGQPGGLRDAPWFKLLGTGGIDLAFRTARRVDPKALLCYNDYGIESESRDDEAKRKAVLELLRGMQQRGVPVDALGIQGHIAAGPQHQYGPGMTEFMAEVERMGLKLMVTEMDVNDRDLEPLETARDHAVAGTYGSFLRTALANPGMIAVLTWGLTDMYTWLNGEDSRNDHLPERCLPFDASLRPVPAFGAEVRALREASPRPLVLGRGVLGRAQS